MKANTIKITGIKKAVGEKKEWESRDYFYKTQIMFNKGTGEVWCDAFTSCNEWKNYHDSNIVSITNYLCERESEINMATIKKACEEINA